MNRNIFIWYIRFMIRMMVKSLSFFFISNKMFLPSQCTYCPQTLILTVSLLANALLWNLCSHHSTVILHWLGKALLHFIYIWIKSITWELFNTAKDISLYINNVDEHIQSQAKHCHTQHLSKQRWYHDTMWHSKRKLNKEICQISSQGASK